MYGLITTQYLANAQITFDENTSLETLPATPDDAKIEYRIEMNLNYYDKKNRKTKYSSFCPKPKLPSKIVFELNGNRNCPPGFLPLKYSREVRKDEADEKRFADILTYEKQYCGF